MEQILHQPKEQGVQPLMRLASPSEIARGFRVQCLTGVAQIESRIKLLDTAYLEKCAIIVVDVLRATTTVCAALAAGADGVLLAVKDYSKLDQPFQPPKTSIAHWRYGGEKDGYPLPGGVIGNSPLAIAPDMLQGTHLVFYSTNGARVVEKAVEYSKRVYLACMANIEATVHAARQDGAENCLIFCGGFYGTDAIEDTVAAGQIAKSITRYFKDITFEHLDDGARNAATVANKMVSDCQLISSVSTGAVGRLLTGIGRGGDIAASINGKNMNGGLWSVMTNQVVQLDPFSDVPVFIHRGSQP